MHVMVATTGRHADRTWSCVGQQAAVVHQLCREGAAAVSRHAACVCFGRCTPPCSSMAYLHAGDCSMSPACGDLVHRALCSMHLAIAESCLCWAHQQCSEAGTFAGRHAACPPSNARLRLCRRLRRCTGNAKRRLLLQQGMQLWKRLPGAARSRSVCGTPLQRWGPLARSKAAVLQGRPACSALTFNSQSWLSWPAAAAACSATSNFSLGRTSCSVAAKLWQGICGRCVKASAAGDAAPVQRDNPADQAAAASVPSAGGAGKGAAGRPGGREAPEMGGQHCAQPLLGEALMAGVDTAGQAFAALLCHIAVSRHCRHLDQYTAKWAGFTSVSQNEAKLCLLSASLLIVV